MRPLVELGWYDGVVTGLQLDLGATAIRASGGYMPLVLLVSPDDTNGELDVFSTLEVLHSGQFNTDLLWYFWGPTRQSRIGLSLGYHYNTILKHGAGLAFQGEAALDVDVSIYYTLGLAVYWRGDAHAERELGRSDASFNFPFGAGLQGGAAIGLLFSL
ncbi:MAG TPA: hypothetical protein VJR89_38285 [Polyangiales bacterium]|nr:hypothetical protein [Polyangiales bacterium]